MLAAFPSSSEVVPLYRALLAKRNAPLASRQGAAAAEVAFGRRLRDGEMPWVVEPTPLQLATAAGIGGQQGGAR